jgi:hypothetical protein
MYGILGLETHTHTHNTHTHTHTHNTGSKARCQPILDDYRAYRLLVYVYILV